VSLGLAMVTRPSQLQILGVDFSSRELSILESLPHAAAETAYDLATAQVNLSWLAAELRARMEEGRRWPEMVLVVEDVDGLGRGQGGRARSAMSAMLRSGGVWGIHILGAANNPGGGLKAAGWCRPDVARITLGDLQGAFDYSCGEESLRLTEIRVSAVELDRIARGWRPRTGAHPSGNDPREAAQGRDS
jgi:hypothetical protein